MKKRIHSKKYEDLYVELDTCEFNENGDRLKKNRNPFIDLNGFEKTVNYYEEIISDLAKQLIKLQKNYNMTLNILKEENKQLKNQLQTKG